MFTKFTILTIDEREKPSDLQ